LIVSEFRKQAGNKECIIWLIRIIILALAPRMNSARLSVQARVFPGRKHVKKLVAV
jgi:hypothetical protein